MGRTKSSPSKLKNSSENWDFPMPIDYIPVKVRRSKRKIPSAPTYKLVKPLEKHKLFNLGELLIGTTSNLLPDEWNECVASFLSKTDTDEKRLILQLDSTSFLVSLLLDCDIIREIFTTKIFLIDIVLKNEDVFFDLYFSALPLPKFNKKIGSCLQSVFEVLYKISYDELENDVEQSSASISQLYKSIKIEREKELKLGDENVQHFRLKPQLRAYQADAVRWMLHRENIAHGMDREIHPLYTPITLQSGLEIFFDKYSGFIELEKPIVEKSSRGGILADEMGLGKTVEVLACILNHPKHNTDNCIENDLDTNQSPTVEKPTRKRRFLKDEEEPKSYFIDESKRIKLSAEGLKSDKRKSQLRVALEMWYDSCLQSSQTVSKEKPKEGVQCVCGHSSKRDSVACCDCGKIQHRKCMGFSTGSYRCPQCWCSQPLIEIGATLIVSPTSLRKQWCTEICKHVAGDFKVLVYGGSAVTPIYPTELAKYDVVITTYGVLQTDLRLTEEDKDFSLRHQRKYSAPKSSLTRVKWWRLCLDEAQTVETPTSKVSEMAKKLMAEFRWAVTGTPISKEISDLHGLIDYLQIEPYNDKLAWNHILFDPYLRGEMQPLNSFLSQVMWRSSKDEVLNQINIPKQTTKEYWLDFSAVEHYFYRCEHQLNYNAFLDKTRPYDPDLALQSLDRSSLKALLAPLLSLRQVCTYPNSIRTRYLAMKKPVKSMKDLLEALITKNVNECEEFLRIVLSALNGLAGIYLLMNEPEIAIHEYRKVLQLYVRFSEEEKIAKLHVDKLQLIHTMHNLAEIVQICPNVDKTLRDDNLEKDCADLEQKYMEKFIADSVNALKDNAAITANVSKLQNSFILKPGAWYSDMLDWIHVYEYSEELYMKIENFLSVANVESTINYRSGRSLLYEIFNWDSSISELREVLLEAIDKLYINSPEHEYKINIPKELVEKASNCHLTQSKKSKSKKKCLVCVANDCLKAYELKLFSMSKRSKNFEDMALKGAWKATTEELIFKSILAVGKLKNCNPDLIKDGEVHLNILEMLKKEFKEIRKFWTFLHQQVNAHDEIIMCKIRLRLKDENEDSVKQPKKMIAMVKNLSDPENKLETIHVLPRAQLDYQRNAFHSEAEHLMANLEKNLGVRSYLETLRGQHTEGQNPDPCPICKNVLDEQWSIIPCGHSYCLECIQKLIEQRRGHHVQCCVCRAYYLIPEISYIKTTEQRTVNEIIRVKGNYSTKVESVINLILDLKTEDNDVKILVFSSWVSVLSYLKAALLNNDVSTEMIASSSIEKQIEKFKDPTQNVTALLLPINLGSKGLNLIEATHVILVEPLLNSGDELQAIGRVHRIGQTKPTVVHKFFIKNTIEESIQKAITSDARNWEKNKVTIKQLIGLFDIQANTDEVTNSLEGTVNDV